MKNMDPKIKHGIFTWEIENFLLCLPEKQFSTESPRFMLARSVWFLNLIVHQNENEIYFVIQLCRGMDSNSRNVTVKFSVSLQSVVGVFANAENERLFKKGNTFDALKFPTTWQDFWRSYGNEDDLDILVIECDITAVKDYTESCNCYEFPSNLMLLTKKPRDAFLVTEGTALPVHKEIICAYSPVFKSLFELGDISLDIGYSRQVVEAMLRYMYSGCIKDILMNGSLPPLDLYKCAEEYKIQGLIKSLIPWRMDAVNIIKAQRISFCFDHPDLAKFFERKHHLRRKISEDIEVTICFNFDCKFEMMTISVKLSRKRNFKSLSLSMLFYILDFEDNRLIRKQHLYSLGYAKDYCFDFKVEKQSLSTITRSLLKRNVLKIFCEFKLADLQESKLSESADIDYLIYNPQNPEEETCIMSPKIETNNFSGYEKVPLNDSFEFQCCSETVFDQNGFVWPPVIYNPYVVY